MAERHKVHTPKATAELLQAAVADLLGAIDRMVATQPSQINWPAADRTAIDAARALITPPEDTEAPAAKK